MTELQKIYKSDDILQSRWKLCMRTTCRVLEVVEELTDLFKRVWEVLKEILNSVQEAFSKLWCEITSEFEIELLADIKPKFRRLPTFKSKTHINTRGFARPITKCARSRC